MANRQPGLSEKQLQVMHFLCEGLTDKEIALRMGVSDRTIHTRVLYIYRKLGARSRAHAVALWLQAKIDLLTVQLETANARNNLTATR